MPRPACAGLRNHRATRASSDSDRRPRSGTPRAAARGRAGDAAPRSRCDRALPMARGPRLERRVARPSWRRSMPCLLRPASTKQTCAPQTLTGRARGGSGPGKMLGARCSRLTLAITLASTGCTTSRRADPPAGVGAPPTPAVTTPPREPHEVALATPPTSLTLEHEPVELVLLRALPIERRD